MNRTGKEKRLLSWSGAFLRVLLLYNIMAIVVLSFLYTLSKDLPPIEKLQSYNPQLVTRIYSDDGVVLKELYDQRRILVEADKIPPAMIHAAVSIEDSRFYNHWGVSVRDIFRAIGYDILTMSAQQGASTFTQQLARMLYEKIGFEKTITRKVKELLTALQIERMYSKDEIAAMFVNSSYMGKGNVHGVQAAAKLYFDKNAEELTPDECAVLAGVIKSAVRFSPFYRPVSAFQRRNLVLKRMMDYNYLTEEEFALYKNVPLEIRTTDLSASIAPYFVEHIRRWIRQKDEKLGVDIYRDGLKIYTTLDTRMQACADTAFHEHLVKQQSVLNRRLLANPVEIENIIKNDTSVTVEQVVAMIKGEIPIEKDYLRKSLIVQGAFIAIEPGTGHIKAMIGGRDYAESEFNRATQAQRQPGSVFKPIVYSTAIDNGFPVSTQLLNQPVILHEADGTRWAPKNYDRSTGGKTTLREGIRGSLNLIAARIVQELISPESVVETAHRMHLSTYIPAVDAIALGAGVVIPKEMVSAYCIFANQGVWVEPISVTRIEDKYGNIIAEYNPRQELVFSEETAFLTTSLLQTVINKGTGGSARWKYKFYKNAAGKTGTTNSFTDAWFVGFTPYIAAGVYVGLDNPAVSLGPSESGARAALPIWANFMRETYKEFNWQDREFEVPEGIVEVEICNETGLLPSKYCQVYSEYFKEGTVPTEHCHIHTDVQTKKMQDRVIY